MYNFHPIPHCSSVHEFYDQIREGLEKESGIHRTAHPKHVIIETFVYNTWFLEEFPVEYEDLHNLCKHKNVYPHNSTPDLLAFNLPSKSSQVFDQSINPLVIAHESVDL